MKKLVDAIQYMNEKNLEYEKQRKNDEVCDLKFRLNEARKFMRSLDIEYNINAKKIVSNLKKLEFINSVAYDKSAMKLTILSKDLKFSYKDTDYDDHSARGNLGPYLFIIHISPPSVSNRTHIERVRGPVYFSSSSARFDHFFVKNNDMCFGTDKMHRQYHRLTNTGQFDLAMTLLWNMLNLKIGKLDIAPHVQPDYFMQEIKNAEREIKKEEARKNTPSDIPNEPTSGGH